MKRSLAIGILSSVLALSACTATTETGDIALVTPPASSVDEDSSGEVAETFNTSDGRVPAQGNLDQSLSILTVPRTRFQETIVEYRTDEFGDYAVTKLDYPSIDSVENKGVSKTQLTSALEFYTDFLTTEVLDSIALDNYANYDRWVEEVAPKYIAAEFFDEVVNGQKNGEMDAVIFNNYRSGTDQSNSTPLPVLLRDGGPRTFNKHFFLLRAEPIGGGVRIFSIGYASILADDKQGLAWDTLVYGPGGEQLPTYQDGKPQAGQMNFHVALELIADGESWKITHYENVFAVNGGEFFIDAPQNLVDWRNSVR